MPKIKTKMGTGAALVIALLALGTFAGVAAIVTKNQFNFAAITSADEGEDDNEAEDDGEDEDEDKDDDKDKEKEQEKAKKEQEKASEKAKKEAEKARESSNKEDDDEDADEVEDENKSETDEDEADEADEDENKGGDNEGMFKDRDKTLSKLQEEIDKARKNILEKQAEGADVTTALARLALAEAGLAQVGTSFDANDLATAKMLAKQIKKTAHFTEKDMEFSKKVAEEVAKVEKRFGQVEKKIAELEGLGGDAAAFKSQLATLRSDFSALKATIAAAPGTITRDTVKAFEKRVKRLKSLVESNIFALGGTDDDDLFEDHEDDADDLSEGLDDVAEIEDGDDNGVSKKVRTIAAEHKAASKAIKKSLGDIEDRGGLAETLFGSDSDALDALNTEVVAMNTRAAALESASKRISDPDLRKILDDQIDTLKLETGKLQSFIASQSEIKGIFGWLSAFIPKF
ncbi:MAG: hypothetical protein A3G09_00465 [Candidatus Moranbacteria bacterium RIFCSPLOWO2_12_FULL_48_12]|nr:MAG: hypothetical protein A3G09_00465 [Candidatus Moranbacteria bacterium RIFCSPLOWO2_12_FULL_48_12]